MLLFWRRDTLFILDVFIKRDFKRSLIYFCRVEGSWICLEWWERWWETWWVVLSTNFKQTESNYRHEWNLYSIWLYFFITLFLQERMSGSPNCQTFSSSTVISYSSTDSGAPEVYQQTSQTRTGPGGVRITNRCWNDYRTWLLFSTSKSKTGWTHGLLASLTHEIFRNCSDNK